MRWPTKPLTAILILVVLRLALPVPANSAQPAGEKVSRGAMAGVVVGPDGKPAIGATVWLVRRESPKDVKALESTTTDNRGRFVFPNARSKYGRPDATIAIPDVLVRDTQGRLGWQWQPWTWPMWTPRQDLKIRLENVQEVQGRVIDAADQPIAGASVRLLGFSMRPEEGGSGLLNELADALACKTDAQGRFTLRGMPVGATLRVAITAAGFGSPQAGWKVSDSVTIRLDRTGSIRGSLASPAKAPLGNLKLSLYWRSEPPKDAPVRVAYGDETSTAADGAFRFDNVPPGKYAIEPWLYEDNRPFFMEQASVEVRPGQPTEHVTLTATPAIEIRGRVVDSATGKGISGVRLCVGRMTDQGYRRPLRETTTDADGQYVAYATPGKTTVQVVKTPKGHVLPSQRGELTKVDVRGPLTWEVIKLEPATKLDVLVIDDAGKPMPGAEVEVLSPHGSMELRQEVEETNADGKASFAGLAAKETVSVRARAGEASSDTRELRPSDAPDGFRLVVSSKKAFAILGTCLDTEGHPIRGARVSVLSQWILGSIGVGHSMFGGWTDAEGRFQVSPLWPGHQYQISVKADGYKELESAWIESRAGQPHDLGKLTLAGLGGFVEGRVVDSAGKPVPEVDVFNCGEAARPIHARTDTAGKFRLEELPKGPLLVFAEKEGFRFTTVRTVASGPALEIRLPRTDEPLPPWKPQRPPASTADQQQAARRMLTKLWAMPGHASPTWVIRLMARIDPEQSKKWSAEIGRAGDSSSRIAELEAIADKDVDEALAILAGENNASALGALKSLVERYAGSDKAKSLRFAEEGLVRVRNLDQPDRTLALAEAGSLVAQLGQVDAGRKLMEEAAEMAAKMNPEDSRSGYHRGLVAAALAPYDLPRALALVEPVRDEGERERAMARLATIRAPQNLEEAMKIVCRLSNRSTLPDNTRLEIAYALAPTKPDDALRIVDGMSSIGAVKVRAGAYGWLAVAIAPQDQGRAWSLIDKGMAMYRQHAEEWRSWSGFGGRTPMAARLVTQAATIGYPDMNSLVGRVLAMRPTLAETGSGQEIGHATVLTAKILALVDPLTARHLLETLQPQTGDREGSDSAGVERRDWLQAWAVADLAEAERILDRILERARANPGFKLAEAGWIEMLDVLTTPSRDQPKALLEMNGGFWFPGQL